jgi:hypothetical protein
MLETKKSIMNKRMLFIVSMRLESSFRKLSAYGLDHWDMISSAAGNGIETVCMRLPSPNPLLTKQYYFLRNKLDTFM